MQSQAVPPLMGSTYPHSRGTLKPPPPRPRVVVWYPKGAREWNRKHLTPILGQSWRKHAETFSWAGLEVKHTPLLRLLLSDNVLGDFHSCLQERASYWFCKTLAQLSNPVLPAGLAFALWWLHSSCKGSCLVLWIRVWLSSSIRLIPGSQRQISQGSLYSYILPLGMMHCLGASCLPDVLPEHPLPPLSIRHSFQKRMSSSDLVRCSLFCTEFGSGVRLKSCYLQIICHWTSHITFLKLSFISWKVVIIITATQEVHVKCSLHAG